MNRKKYLILLVSFSVFTIGSVMAQLGCGTVVSASQQALESSVSISEGTPTQSLPQVNRKLSISVFVVKNQVGQSEITDQNIQDAITALNVSFSPIALSFQKCTVQYISNYQFNSINAATINEHDMLVQYNELNTINLYLVNQLYDQGGRIICGYTYMPGDLGKHSIFMKKTCLSDGSSLAHQMGHFFNLYHTHEDVYGLEVVARDSTNCKAKGDRCCDTDADPRLDGKVNTDCVYTGLIKDANLEYYHPSPKNLMSFSLNSCRCVFSRTQFVRMINALDNFRKNLH
jgi:hypothetical protein